MKSGFLLSRASQAKEAQSTQLGEVEVADQKALEPSDSRQLLQAGIKKIADQTGRLSGDSQSISQWLKQAEKASTIGLSLYTDGNPTDALKFFENALKKIDRLMQLNLDKKQKLAIAEMHTIILSNAGMISTNLNQYDTALKFLEQSLKICNNFHNRQLRLNKAGSLCNMGKLQTKLGNFTLARTLFDQSLEISKATGDKKGISTIYDNMGVLFEEEGDFENAIKCFRKVLAGSQTLDDQNLKANLLCNLGALLNRVGQNKEALEKYRSSLEIFKSCKNNAGIARASRGLGTEFELKGELHKAEKYYYYSLKVFEDLRDREGQSRICNSLGILFRKQGCLPQALKMHLRSMELDMNMKVFKEIALGFCSIGHIYSDMGDHKNALEFYRKALQSLNERERGGAETCAGINHNIALSHFMLGNYDSAIQSFEKAIYEVESTEVLLSEDRNRVSYFEMYLDSYRCLQKALLLMKRPHEALAVSERSKARSLSNIIATKVEEDGASCGKKPGKCWEDISRLVKNEGSAVLEYSIISEDTWVVWMVSPSGLLEACEEIQAQVTGKNSKCVKLSSLIQLMETAQKSSRSETQHKGPCKEWEILQACRLNSNLEKHPVRRLLTVEPFDTTDMRGVEELGMERARASAQECRDVWLWLESQVPILVDALNAGEASSSNSGNVIDFATKVIETLKAEIRTWCALCEVTDDFLLCVCRITCEETRRIFLSFVLEITDEEWILQQLFSKLIQPVEEKLINYEDLLIVPHVGLVSVPWAALLNSKGQYLVEHHTLRMVPSLSVLQGASQSTQTPADAKVRPVLVVGNPWPVSQLGFAELPFAESEADWVHGEIQQSADKAQSIIRKGSSATVSEILQHLDNCPWGHFACHGYLPKDALVLATSLSDHTSDDGLLTKERLQALKLAPCSTMVLSACDTARGEIRNGEGVLGLSRGFLAAGAGAVVVSQQHVGDRSTFLLMQAMYAGLTQGMDVPQALRRAQLSIIGRQSILPANEVAKDTERNWTNLQGLAEKRGLELLFRAGKPFDSTEYHDGRGRLTEETLAKLFGDLAEDPATGRLRYVDLFGPNGGAVRKALKIERLDLVQGALECFKVSVRKRQENELLMGFHQGHRYMLEQIGATNIALNKLLQEMRKAREQRRTFIDGPPGQGGEVGREMSSVQFWGRFVVIGARTYFPSIHNDQK